MIIYKTALFPDFIDILQRKHLNKRYIVDLDVNTFSMIPNMTGFEIMEVSGQTAAVGHTWVLGNAQDSALVSEHLFKKTLVSCLKLN